MSKIGEYLKLIPKAFANPDKIVEGIINSTRLALGILPEDIEDEIVRRRIICASCPFMSDNAKKNPAMNYKSDRDDEHCTFCSCNIEFKTSSLQSNCGIETHNIQNPDSPLPLKWTRYIPNQTNQTENGQGN